MPVATKETSSSRRAIESTANFLKVPALEIRQGKRRLYSFAVDGKQLHEFCTIARLSRQNGELDGYQRPEVMSHIKQITEYLESEDSILPNAIVCALNSSVEFEPDMTTEGSGYGTITIPIDTELPVGWIVDGQQRAAAIRAAEIGQFEVAVIAFIADKLAEQRQQFILVNSTKPLSVGLLNELLPLTDGVLPARWRQRKYPAEILYKLNSHHSSPFRNRVKTLTNPEGDIGDAAFLRMLRRSLTDGVLFDAHDPGLHFSLICAYWSAVSRVFSSAWNSTQRQSILLRPIGIQAMSFFLDALVARLPHLTAATDHEFEEHLLKIHPYCQWTQDSPLATPENGLDWTQLRNTDTDILKLTNYIVRQYSSQANSIGT